MKVLGRFYVALAGFSLAACGPAFTTLPDVAGDGGPVANRIEPARDAGAPFVSRDASDMGEKSPSRDAAADVATVLEDAPSLEDAGEHDAGADALEVLVDAGVPDAHDAAPPPALCCATPCSGVSIADIACTAAAPWTCAMGSCTAGACHAGAVCHWMGTTCTGTVEACP